MAGPWPDRIVAVDERVSAPQYDVVPGQKASITSTVNPIQYRPMSLFGPLQVLLVPQGIGFDDPKEFGRAIAAWTYGLSRQEVTLLEHIARGLTNGEIAEQLGVAEENTVKNRIKAVFKKLGVDNRVQAAQIPTYYGFGEPPVAPSKHSNG